MDPHDQRNLEAENARLRAKIAELERRLAESEKQSEQLKATIDKLKAALDEAERSSKRQAAPFRKPGGPKPKPKKPGRKSGKRHGIHAHGTIPSKIDEHYDVPLPDECPKCCGRDLIETEVVTQYQTEIPRRPVSGGERQGHFGSANKASPPFVDGGWRSWVWGCERRTAA